MLGAAANDAANLEDVTEASAQTAISKAANPNDRAALDVIEG